VIADTGKNLPALEPFVLSKGEPISTRRQ